MLLLNPFYLPATSTTDMKPNFPGNNSGIMPSSPPSPSSPLTKTDTVKTSSQPRPIRRCTVCQQEFRNKALLRMHMSTFHPNETNKKNSNNKQDIKQSSTLSISSSNNLGFLHPYVDTASPLAHKLVAGQGSQTSYGILHDSYFCAKMADRVVCEICNKQVCNKYFLKTHKGKTKINEFYLSVNSFYSHLAKVHGIINGTNNPSNGNADNTSPPTMVSNNNLQQTITTNVIKSPTTDNHQDEQIENDAGMYKFTRKNSCSY